MTTDIRFPIPGSCNCGNVTYEVLAPFLKQGACHCTQCQKHTQSAFSLVGVLKSEDFRLLTGTLKRWTKTAASGNPIDCYFCPRCGNRIYHQPPSDRKHIRLKLGTLDDTRIISPQAHIWTQHKQQWLQLPAGVPSYEKQG